jgi:hypothetical protein
VPLYAGQGSAGGIIAGWVNVLQVLIAPLFFTIPFGLTRAKGHRLLGGVALHAVYLFLAAVLFGGGRLGNTLVLCVLYGPRRVMSGEIRILPTRGVIALTNGDRYAGFQVFLWYLVIFVTLASVGFAAVRVGRWAYSRSPLVRRIAARFARAIESKRPAS